ncbi:MAG: efflux RND transporter periplasmic adaptor subunit [Natronospirillum sp.]
MKKYFGQFAAIVMLIILTVWMYSGLDADLAPIESVEAPAADRLVRVQYRTLEQEVTERSLMVNGETRVNRELVVRAQVSGEVAEVLHREGARIVTGATLLRIDPVDLPGRLRSAQALENQRESELDGVRQLVERGLQNVSDGRAAEALYQDAVANRRSLELQLQRTTVRAPFSGVIENLSVEPGSYLSVGAELVHILDYSPLKVRVQVSENKINELALGNPAQVTLVTGNRFAGEVSFISSRANAETRTFTVDIQATTDAPEAAGVSAEITFPLAPIDAHFVSPSLLALNEDGDLMLKHLNDDDVVVASTVRMVRSSTQGIWVTGLPPTVRLITVGQGFVSPGDRVEPVAVEQ